MKKQSAFLLLGMFALMISAAANGQTYQTGWTLVLDNEPAICLDKNLSGTMTYHAVIKVDKIERLIPVP